MNTCGAAARVGYEIASDSDVTIETPMKNFSYQFLIHKIKDFRAEDRPIIINLKNNKVIREWPYAKLCEEGSLRGPNLVTLLNKLYRGDDFNSPLINFSRYIKYLKDNGIRTNVSHK